MRLSTSRGSLLTCLVLAVMSQACSSCRSPKNDNVPVVITPTQELPFPTKEPDVYQANAVVIAGDVTDEFFIARKGDKLRTDILEKGQPVMTELLSGARIVLDHKQRTYYQESTASTTPSSAVSPIASFFTGKPYSTFREVSRSGSITRYQVQMDNTKDIITLDFDTSVGMIVSQQFTAENGSVTVRYELRNVRLQVDDALFAIPGGYKQVQAPKP